MTDKQTQEKTTENDKQLLLGGLMLFVIGTASLSSLFFDEVNPDRALLLLFVGLSFCVLGTILFFEGLALGYRIRFHKNFGIWSSQDEDKKHIREGAVIYWLSQKARDLSLEYSIGKNHQNNISDLKKDLKRMREERPPIDLSSLKEKEKVLTGINKQITRDGWAIKLSKKNSRVFQDIFWRAHKVARFFGMTECSEFTDCDGKCS